MQESACWRLTISTGPEVRWCGKGGRHSSAQTPGKSSAGLSISPINESSARRAMTSTLPFMVPFHVARLGDIDPAQSTWTFQTHSRGRNCAQRSTSLRKSSAPRQQQGQQACTLTRPRRRTRKTSLVRLKKEHFKCMCFFSVQPMKRETKHL